MLFDVVLKSGKELKCYSNRNAQEIIEEMYKNDFVKLVQENAYPKMITVFYKDGLDYFRFPNGEFDNIRL